MKIKSVLASVAACALAVSAMALTAAAEVTNGAETGNDGKKFWSFDVKSNTADVTKVYGFEVKVTPADAAMPDGMGGGMGLNSESTGWKSVEWGNPDSGKAVIVDTTNWTLRYINDTAFTSTDTYAQVWVQSWWGCDLTVDSVKLLDKDGNEVAQGAPASSTTTTTTTTTTASGTTTTTTSGGTTTTTAAGTKTGDAGVGVAVAGLSLAAVAAFAARKKH